MDNLEIIAILFAIVITGQLLLWVYCVFNLKSRIDTEQYRRENNVKYLEDKINTDERHLSTQIRVVSDRFNALQKHLKVDCKFIQEARWVVEKESPTIHTKA